MFLLISHNSQIVAFPMTKCKKVFDLDNVLESDLY